MTVDKNKIVYRYSTDQDYNAIKKLTDPYFGMLEDVVDVIDNRYLLAVYEGEIIALSGVNYYENYRGLEIDYTCTADEYKRQGIMHEIFRRMLSNVSEKVFCGCWRIAENDKCNLYSFMQDFGFKKVIHCMSSYVNGYNCFADSIEDCFYFSGKNICHCFDDLWIREV